MYQQKSPGQSGDEINMQKKQKYVSSLRNINLKIQKKNKNYFLKLYSHNIKFILFLLFLVFTFILYIHSSIQLMLHIKYNVTYKI